MKLKEVVLMVKSKSKVNKTETEVAKPVKSGTIDGYSKYSVGNHEHLILSEGKGYKTTISLDRYKALTPEQKLELKKLKNR
jgi:hypothetical protein